MGKVKYLTVMIAVIIGVFCGAITTYSYLHLTDRLVIEKEHKTVFKIDDFVYGVSDNKIIYGKIVEVEFNEVVNDIVYEVKTSSISPKHACQYVFETFEEAQEKLLELNVSFKPDASYSIFVSEGYLYNVD